jgi:hypothetical protein
MQVIEFLTAEGFSQMEIHRCVRSVSGEDAVDVSPVRPSVPHFKSSEKDTGDCAHRDRPAKATTVENKKKVDALIWNEGRIRTVGLCIAIGIEKPAVMATIRQFSYRRV